MEVVGGPNWYNRAAVGQPYLLLQTDNTYVTDDRRQTDDRRTDRHSIVP